MSVISRPLLVPINRDLHIPHIFLPRLGFSSVPRLPGWSFQQRIYGGVLPIFPLQAGFPPLIRCEKTAPLHQSLQKSPPPFRGLQGLSGCAKISNRDCEDIFKQLGEMGNTYIIFCYVQELSEFYFLHNQQPTTINGLHVIFQRYTKLDLKYLGDMLYRLKNRKNKVN